MEQSTLPTERQRRFLKVVLIVLVDLTVLNLFVEYSDRVVIDSFTISLFTAILLSVLLEVTLALEHRLAGFFRARSGGGAMVLRILATWGLLFGSKIVILEVVDLIFGDHVYLGGLLTFIALVIAMLVAEAVIQRVYDALA